MIAIHNLTKTYGTTRALDGISFEIARGEICGYIGPNGAGKSTTVKIINGILTPDAGEVIVDGIDALAYPERIKPLLGYVPETGAVFEALTPREYVRFAGRMYGLSDRLITDRSALLLDYFGLTSASDAMMTTFSKGMKQKVIIATALLHSPAVYFFDEPLDGLDAHATLQFKELLRHLALRGKTILYCSHLLDIVERICHRMIILKNGSIVAHGSIDDLRTLTSQETLEEAFNILTDSGEVEDKTIRFLDTLDAMSA